MCHPIKSLFIYLFKHIKLGQTQIDRPVKAETLIKHTEFKPKLQLFFWIQIETRVN